MILKYGLMSNLLFFMGIIGFFLVSKHMLILLFSLEMIFLAMSFMFMVSSVFFDDMMGQFYVVCILAVAAAESSMGLAILVLFYSLSGGMSLDLLKLLKN